MTNPYRAPDADVSMADGQPLQPKRHPLWELFHPLNFVVLLGLWLEAWLLGDEGSLAILCMLCATLASGCIGHLVYLKLLKTPVTVFMVTLAFTNLLIAGWMLMSTGRVDLEFLAAIPLTIPSSLRFDMGLFGLAFISTAFILMALTMTAHTIRANWRTALTSAVGVGLWYSISMMVLSHAG